MTKILTYRFGKPISIYAFTDVHIGAKGHDTKKFAKAIATLKADKNAYCFFNGDNLEFIPPNYGIPEGGQVKSTDEQIEEFVSLLKDLGKKVLFFRSGNHEERAWRLGGVEIARHISRETKIPHLPVGMAEVQVFIGNRRIRLVTSHGEGGSATKVLTNMQLSFSGADIYFVGHSHKFYCNVDHQTVDTESGFEIMKNVIEMAGGSFCGWADYARAKNMRPTQTGCYVLSLTKDGVSVAGRIV